jgi:hypothetical protein
MLAPEFMQVLSMIGTLGNCALGRFGHQHHHHHHQQQPQGQGPLGSLEGELERAEQDLAGMGGDLGGFGGMGGPGGFGGFGNMWPGGQGDFGGFGCGWPQFGQGGFDDQQQPWSATPTQGGPFNLFPGEHIDLGNYTLDLNKSNMQWKLTNKETGAVTNISGDPHVQDGAGHWDFKNNLSLQLEDGTRITVHTIPYGNGATVSSELDITRGGQGMRVTGLGGNFDGPLQVTGGLNGYALDATNLGTDTIYENGNNWMDMFGQMVTQGVASADQL